MREPAANGPKFLSDSEEVLQVTVRMRSGGSTCFSGIEGFAYSKGSGIITSFTVQLYRWWSAIQ